MILSLSTVKSNVYRDTSKERKSWKPKHDTTKEANKLHKQVRIQARSGSGVHMWAKGFKLQFSAKQYHPKSR